MENNGDAKLLIRLTFRMRTGLFSGAAENKRSRRWRLDRAGGVPLLRVLLHGRDREREQPLRHHRAQELLDQVLVVTPTQKHRQLAGAVGLPGADVEDQVLQKLAPRPGSSRSISATSWPRLRSS
jgi:hypothetical protein